MIKRLTLKKNKTYKKERSLSLHIGACAIRLVYINTKGMHGSSWAELEGFFNSTHHGQFEKNLTQTT